MNAPLSTAVQITTQQPDPYDVPDYLGTGFSFRDVMRMGITENHPAIMRLHAYTVWAKATYARGERPADVRAKLDGLRGNAAQARRKITEAQRRAYIERDVARDCGTPPAQLPRVIIPRGRTGSKSGTVHTALRPDLNWADQHRRDVGVLLELGKSVPWSTFPSAWERTQQGRSQAPVPVERRMHSPLSCSGRTAAGAACKRCRRLGDGPGSMDAHARRSAVTLEHSYYITSPDRYLKWLGA